MYIVIGILAGIIILQAIILWKHVRQVKDICRQLSFQMKQDSNMLISRELDFGGIGRLVDLLNELLDMVIEDPAWNQKGKLCDYVKERFGF